MMLTSCHDLSRIISRKWTSHGSSPLLFDFQPSSLSLIFQVLNFFFLFRGKCVPSVVKFPSLLWLRPHIYQFPSPSPLSLCLPSPSFPYGFVTGKAQAHCLTHLEANTMSLAFERRKALLQVDWQGIRRQCLNLSPRAGDWDRCYRQG